MRFSSYSVERVEETTQEAIYVNKNAEVLERFVESVSVANESKAIVRRDFSYYEEAVQARDILLARIDAMAETSFEDSEYDALQNLRKQVTSALPPETQSLPKLGIITLVQTVPSLVTTYDLYESLDRDEDIIARNNIRHPGFMLGGTVLEVLIDG